MGDPVPSSAISDATTGGLSLIVITGGSTGQVLTLQANGTYAPATASAGIGGSVGATDNRLVRSDGTGGSTVQSTGITVDDSNNVSGMGSLGCTSINGSSNSTFTGYVAAVGGVYIGSFDGFVTKSGSGASRTLDLCGVSIVRARNESNSADGPFSASSITASALMCCGVYTFSTVPSASSNTGKFLRISDRAQKHAYSDGTNWRFFGDDAIIS